MSRDAASATIVGAVAETIFPGRFRLYLDVPPTTRTSAAGAVSPSHARLAQALRALQTLQRKGEGVFRSASFEPAHRRALVAAGFLRQIVRGWYMATRPGETTGDTTSWFATMRPFIAAYCDRRFRKK